MNIVPPQLDLVARQLHQAAVRHHVYSHNLANINTPGFQRLEVEAANASVRPGADGSVADAGSASIVVDRKAVPRADGNSVDVDLELSAVGRNSLAAQTYIRILASKLEMMKTAITGR